MFACWKLHWILCTRQKEMRPEKYILLGYQICKLSGIDMNISFCTFVWNIRLLELKSAKQWNLKFMLYLPTPRLLSQIFLKYYSQVSISWKYTIYFEYLLSEVYFKTSNVLRFIVLLTHICAGIREFLQMCQNNGKDSIQFCVHCSILLTFLKILL